MNKKCNHAWRKVLTHNGKGWRWRCKKCGQLGKINYYLADVDNE